MLRQMTAVPVCDLCHRTVFRHLAAREASRLIERFVFVHLVYDQLGSSYASPEIKRTSYEICFKNK